MTSPTTFVNIFTTSTNVSGPMQWSNQTKKLTTTTTFIWWTWTKTSWRNTKVLLTFFLHRIIFKLVRFPTFGNPFWDRKYNKKYSSWQKKFLVLFSTFQNEDAFVWSFVFLCYQLSSCKKLWRNFQETLKKFWRNFEENFKKSFQEILLRNFEETLKKFWRNYQSICFV